MFDFLKKPTEDVRLEVAGATLVFNHRTKTALLQLFDANVTDAQVVPLEKHLKSKGYFLQVIAPSASAIPQGRVLTP